MHGFAYKNVISHPKKQRSKQSKEPTSRTTSVCSASVIQGRTTSSPQSSLSFVEGEQDGSGQREEDLLKCDRIRDTLERFEGFLEPSFNFNFNQLNYSPDDTAPTASHPRSVLNEDDRRVSNASESSSNSTNSFQAAYNEREIIGGRRPGSAEPIRPPHIPSPTTKNPFHLEVIVFKDGTEFPPRKIFRDALFDTGCEGSNWIHSDISETLDADIIDLPSGTFVTLEGQSFSASKATKLCIQRPGGKRTYPILFYINCDLPYDLVLGAEFCNKNDVYGSAVLGGLRTVPKSSSQQKTESADQAVRDRQRKDEQKRADIARKAMEEKKRRDEEQRLKK